MKVLFAIPTCIWMDYSHRESPIHHTGVNERVRAIQQTWAQDIPKFPGTDLQYFYGKLPPGTQVSQSNSVFFHEVNDNYLGLSHKVQWICRYAVEEGYDWIFKCDDDTYCYVERLLEEIRQPAGDYLGFAAVGSCHGGAGYWLSRKAAYCVAIADKPTASEWAEDRWVSSVLFRYGINPVHLESHLSGYQHHWINLDKLPSDHNYSALHAIKPEGMYRLRGGQLEISDRNRELPASR